MDWEFPAKESFDSLIPHDKDFYEYQMLSTALRAYVFQYHPKFLLTATVGVKPEHIHRENFVMPSYEVSHLTRDFDMINLLSFGWHDGTEDFTAHHALSHEKVHDDRQGYSDNVEWVLENFLSLGANPSKMSLGIRSFANTYSLKYSSEHGYLSPANGPGAPGKYTHRPGTLAFYEICDVTNKWYLRVVRDHESKVPYAVGTVDEHPYDSQWIGFDNEQSVAYKVELAKHYRLGGISFFSLDGDDFTGRFCNGGQ